MGHQSLPDLKELYKPAPPDSTPQFEFVSSNPLCRINSMPTSVSTPCKPQQQQQHHQLRSYNQLVIPANPLFPTTETVGMLDGQITDVQKGDVRAGLPRR
jgi:hypothetical protein